ncbi:MAG: DUF6519 domain-containing protein [Sedimenticolaceae bacterium]
MKGDFSKLDYIPGENFTGVWQQQGRVLTDQDWNADTQISRHLRELVGQDAFGPNTVAIPAAERDNLQVLQASSDGSTVQLTLEPGRGWLDGLHLYLGDQDPVVLSARYYGPPIADPLPDAGSIAAGVRDAVVLEVWEEAFSAFQGRRPKDLPGDPERFLLEPALGGPDTSERSKLQYVLRLLRLEPDEDCANLDRLIDDPDDKGRLSVTPEPSLGVTGECPVDIGGGFTGFEHYLIRVEIAAPDAGGAARFKWSRFNGGLVGRGVFDNAVSEVSIEANDQMINHCGLTEFWFEALAHDPELGHWRAYMTADASLVADGRLQLTNIDGAPPVAGEAVFFRLWDGIEPIADFATGIPVAFEMGLRLQFDAASVDNSNYRPGDYWTFPVRAAGVELDPDIEWPDNAPPGGVTYHRAPLAIVTWSAGPVVTETGSPAIHDCRQVFQPLTRQHDCCSFKVGDGLQSFGDFDSIQAAIDHLPADRPGKVCVLPGTYVENIVIARDDVTIYGCGIDKTLVISDQPDVDQVIADAVFQMTGQRNLTISGMTIEAHPTAIGIEIRDFAPAGGAVLPARDVVLADLRVRAAQQSAILVDGVEQIKIQRCQIEMEDVPGPWPGVYLRGDDGLLEHNRIVTGPRNQALGIDDDLTAADGEPIGLNTVLVDAIQPQASEAGRGGLQIGGGSERVDVIDNRIAGGIGNGITLGSLIEIDDQGNFLGRTPGWVVNRLDPCDPCAPGDGFQPPPQQPGDPRFVSEGALYDLRIERNRIEHMGMNGIGVVAFFDLDEEDEFISVVRLAILDNRIRQCLRRTLAPIPQAMRRLMGYGGIALADVEYLRLYDNVIEHNGPDQRQTVCGVFALHAAGFDACRNRIRNNGAKTAEGEDDVMQGPRGGIVIIFALPGIDSIEVLGNFRPRQNGVPAIRIHDNQISQPLGQALFLQALGPVSVQGNQLASQGIIMDAAEPSFWASTVWIFNLGWSNEFYLQSFVFTGVTSDPGDPGALPSIRDNFTPEGSGGLDDNAIGRYMANGNVSFTNNQVLTDLTETQVDFAISSTLIISLDDVTVQNNQFDCDYLIDLLFSNLIAVGMTVRIQDNRFKESLFVTLFSSIGFGLIFNNTSDNQATHCVISLESPLDAWFPFLTTSIKEHDNQVLFNSISFLGFWCELFGRFERLFVTDDQTAAATTNPNTEILGLLR